MRIALTYNLKRSADEAYADLDSAATVRAIARLIAASGHRVTRVEVSGPVERVVARLRALAPDLVFNIAEGLRGPFREALWPALFEELGLAYTGSPPSVLAMCLDKALACRVVAAAGVSVPGHGWPAIVKPRFEGSSIGISQRSVVRDETEAAAAVARAGYPCVVERFVDGADVAVGWVAGLGLLPAIHYVYEASGPHRIMDRAVKERGAAVEIRALDHPSVPGGPRLREAAERAFAALGVVGFGRADFRLTADGEPVFLEMNPLPSLDPEEGDLYAACGIAAHELIAAIIDAVPECAREVARARSGGRRM